MKCMDRDVEVYVLQRAGLWAYVAREVESLNAGDTLEFGRADGRVRCVSDRRVELRLVRDCAGVQPLQIECVFGPVEGRRSHAGVARKRPLLGGKAIVRQCQVSDVQ